MDLFYIALLLWSKVSDEAIFPEECRQDNKYRNRVLGLERMLRVKAQKESTSVPEGALPGKLVASHVEKTLPRSVMGNAFETNIRDLRVLRGPSEGAGTALHVFAPIFHLLLCLLLLHIRMLRSCMVHVTIRGRTRGTWSSCQTTN